VDLMDDRSTHRGGAFALNDDGATCAVDDILHENVSSFVGSTVGLPDFLVAEVPEYVLETSSNSNPERSSKTAILLYG